MGKKVNKYSVSFDKADPGTQHISIKDSIEKYRFTLDETASDHLLGGPGQEGHTSPLPGRADLPFSISAWVFLDNAPNLNQYYGIVTKWGSGAGYGVGAKEYLLVVARTTRGGLTNNRLIFSLYDDISSTGFQNRYKATSDFPIGEWKHVVATYGANSDFATDTTDIVVYIDGVAQQHGVQGVYEISNGYEAMPALNDSVSPLVIGNIASFANTPFPFNGRSGDVCIFNKKLSSSEVLEIYDNGHVKDMTKFSDQSSLISWWKMGDDGDNGEADGIRDQIGGYHGTLNNGASIVETLDLPSDIIVQPQQRVYGVSSVAATRAPNSPFEYTENLVGNDKYVIPSATVSSGESVWDLANTSRHYGLPTGNQRYMHLLVDSSTSSSGNKNIRVGAMGYINAFGIWAQLVEHELPSNEPENTNSHFGVQSGLLNGQASYRVFDILGVDKVIFFGLNANLDNISDWQLRVAFSSS
jgi:hypothetical protein